MAVRASNTRVVEAWNAAAAAGGGSGDGPGFKLAVNRFADWLPEEYAALMTAKRSSSRSEAIKVRGWLMVFNKWVVDWGLHIAIVGAAWAAS
jgi:hypothetical protein